MNASPPSGKAGTLTYFFRHPRPEYHSIERLFAQLANLLNRQAGHEWISQVRCPQSRVTPLNLLRNCWYAHRHRGTVNHITGDVHYLALVLPRKSTILTIHDCVLLTRYPAWHPMHWFHYYVWYKWPTNRAGIVTTISEKSKNELVQLIGVSPDKIQVTPNFYDPALIHKVKIPSGKKPPVILHVGTAPHKNLKRLVEAIAGIRCKLLIVGKLADGDLQLLTKYRIDYDNYVDSSQKEMLTLYERCDVVAFVSLYEGFGLPILEGQVVGRPVLTSNLSPMNDIGGSGACYVDPYNVADIRQGIQRIFQDEAYRNRLVLEGQQNAESYSIERVAKRYMALYESIHQTMPQE